ncbi:VWA domain-containing protein [Frankia sp. CiP3]|uniref:VWA domain-containing protein n=1 Tax=Frankia sp. CiP3 TaxID=2880971 RepID=UPI0027E17FDB|nr:VWA domain-containing protein [Frankia sp. CiP3]
MVEGSPTGGGRAGDSRGGGRVDALSSLARRAILRPLRNSDRTGALSTSADTADLMRELAQDFIDADRADGCRRENIQAVSPSAAGGTTKALADGWPADDLRTVGPYPHVWIPSSSVEVARVQQALRTSGSAITLTSLPSVMSSYLVLAAPKSLAGRPQWDDPNGLSLTDVLRQAENSTLRIVREGPEASTEGLISTMALYRAATGGRLDEKTLGDGQTRAELHRLEQATITSGGIEDPGRGLGCRAATSAERSFEVAFMSEQRVFTHNVQQSPSCGVPAENLTAFYPTDGAPLLDYPFVIVGGDPWGDRQREAVARRLHDFLTGELARARLAESGFRPPGGAALNGSSPDSGLQDKPPHTIYRVVDPDGRSVAPDALVQTWRSVRRQASVLFAVDVSGSMDVPGTDGVTLLDSTKQAIEPALSLVSDADEIGLWEFSTVLDGIRDYVQKVGLGPAGTGPDSRRDKVRQALRGLRRENGDTGLFDTIQAGVAALRAGKDTTTADALVVFTDGINDKSGGAGVDSLVADLNRPGTLPVRVFLLAFGEANCDRPDLRALLAGGVKCENVSSTDVSRAVERVGAGLWGVD